MIWLEKWKPLAAIALTVLFATAGVAVQRHQNKATQPAPTQPITAPQNLNAGGPPNANPDITANRALARQQLPLIDKALDLMHNLAQGSRWQMADAAFSLWERRRLDTLRKAGAPKAEIIAALEKDLKRIEKEEAISKSQFERAQSTQLAIFDAQFRRLQTQIWLNEEKAR